MDARTIKRAIYFFLAASGVGLAVVALFLLTQTVQKSDDFDRLQDVILAINIAGGVLLIAFLIGNLARLAQDYRRNVPGAKLKARIVGDTGAYASVGSKVVERAVGHATGAYHVPMVDIEGLTVYTNNIPCGAMRGFGVNPATFGLESCLDDLCEQGGFDRWQFRFDNALTEQDQTATGQVLKGGVGVRVL